MKKVVLMLGLVGSLLAACSKSDSSSANDANVVTFNDFENFDGWLPPTPSLTRDQAHSGKFSIKVDGNTEFSTGYSNMLGKVSPKRMRKIKLQAWAYMPSDKSTARLGIQITDPATGQEIFGDGINFADEVKKTKTWVEISKEVTLPENITAAQNLKLFLWRSSATDAAFVDDVSLSIVE